MFDGSDIERRFLEEKPGRRRRKLFEDFCRRERLLIAPTKTRRMICV